jgi:hypothetical protein
MKVHIGPYTDYIGPYQIAEKVFFWIDHRAVLLDETLENRWDVKACNKFGDWLDKSWVHKFCLWLDSKKRRKIDVRIDSYDTWSMDHTLALIIHPMLVQLRDTNHGYFSSDPEDAPHIGQDPGTDFTNDSKALDRYKWIMDEMIWAFDTLKTDEDYKLFYTEENGWDFEGQRLHNERIDNGLRLFGKYFRGLWD